MMSAAEVRAAVDQVRTAWFELAAQDDAAGVAALYASDAVLVDAEGTVARGPAEIEAFWAQGFPVASDLQSEVLEFRAAGDVAYETGTYSQTITIPDMDAMTVSGNYAVVSEQQADGSWKITMHVSSQHPPTM
jgi:uncharacterized protein (TIGR02246 family)